MVDWNPADHPRKADGEFARKNTPGVRGTQRRLPVGLLPIDPSKRQQVVNANKRIAELENKARQVGLSQIEKSRLANFRRIVGKK